MPCRPIYSREQRQRSPRRPPVSAAPPTPLRGPAEKSGHLHRAGTPRDNCVHPQTAAKAIQPGGPQLGAMSNIRGRDEILVTVMEHQKAIVGASGSCWLHVPVRCCACRLNRNREARPRKTFKQKLSKPNRLVERCSDQHTLGCLNRSKAIAKLSHGPLGALLLLSLPKACRTLRVNVTALGAEFLVGSSHKLCGTHRAMASLGAGALLEAMPRSWWG